MTRVLKEALLHLFFPHICDGCGSDLIGKDHSICLRCTHALPQTLFESLPANPIEKKFYGRINLYSASATYYFAKGSVLQHLVHQVKYQNNPQLAFELGYLMGISLRDSMRFNADLMIPVPLFPARQKSRGYNQSTLLCKGIQRSLNIPIKEDIIFRPEHTETQTKKGRIERWRNSEGKFFSMNMQILTNNHILLVDDILTTGATLEACGTEILKASNTKLSIACLGFASA